MSLPPSSVIWFLLEHYLVALACIWFTVHHMANGQTKREKNDRTFMYQSDWLMRHPWAMIAMMVFMAGIPLTMSAHLNEPFQKSFNEFFYSGAFLASWPSFVLLLIGSIASVYLYRSKRYTIAGSVSFAVIMLAGFVLPYYTIPLLS
jgi:NADH:ubiquinone oxidoreductase subunit 5 (subunit L)/multisubunit Na+/H+ antiporter MnhA subunit